MADAGSTSSSHFTTPVWEDVAVNKAMSSNHQIYNHQQYHQVQYYRGEAYFRPGYHHQERSHFENRQETGLGCVPEEISNEVSSRGRLAGSYGHYNCGGVKLIEAARQGFGQFCKDFNEDQREEWSGGFQVLPPSESVFDFTPDTVRSDVDDRLLVDSRPVISYTDGGQREYHLFDEFINDAVMKNVYNVNDMDILNLFEICGRMLLPRSVERWPIELLGKDLAQLKKKILLLKVPEPSPLMSQSAIRNTELEMNWPLPHEHGQIAPEEKSEVGAFGLLSLARLCNFQGLEQNPMGFLTFTGMNLHKLMMNLDKNHPVTGTFAGPLASHNYSLDFNYIEMAKPFEEYNLPCQNWDLDEMTNWKKTMRITKQKISGFCFDVLVYIFYTFHGDALQVLAANELYERGWRFHKTFQVWLKPWNGEHGGDDCRIEDGLDREDSSGEQPSSSPKENAWDSDSDSYKYFNYEKWAFLIHKFRINEGALEARPPEFDDVLWLFCT